MTDTAEDAKIPVDIIYIKEEPDPWENWLHVKEKSVDHSAQADVESENKFSSLLLPPPEQESGDGSNLNRKSKTSLCKETNFGVHKDVTKVGEVIKHNASCDTTSGSQLTSQLRPTEQVFVDLPGSEVERTSTFKDTEFGVHKDVTKIKEDIEYNASCDTTYGSQLTSQLQPTEQVFVEDFPNIEGERTATCEETNFGDTKIGEDIKYNASYDTTYGSRLTSQLQPAEQVRDNSEGERTSTCEKTMSGFSQEVSGSNCYIKLEEDDSLSEDWVEIKEEALNFDTHYDDMCGVQSTSLSPLPEGKGNSVEHELRKTKAKIKEEIPKLLSPSGKRKLSGI